MIELVTGIITNEDTETLFVKSSKHCWWELPGAKLDDDPTVSPEWTLCQTLRSKLGLNVALSKTALPRAAMLTGFAGGIDFIADTRWVESWEGAPVETAASDYSETSWMNPLWRRIGHMSLSPITQNFITYCQNEPQRLQTAD